MTPEQGDDVVAAIREFLELQHALLEAFSDLGGPTRAGGPLREVPATGTMALGPDLWRYRRHGGGVEFRAERTGVVVDAHVAADRADVFDVWRLRRYFGSLGRRRHRALAGAADAPLEVIVRTAIGELEERRLIERDGDLLRLATPGAPACE